MKSTPPKSFVEVIEAAGGFYKSTDPETGTKGWVLFVEFKDSSDKVASSITEFLLPTRESAQQIVDTTPPFTKLAEGIFVTVCGIIETKKYYHCSFCGIERKRAGVFFRSEGEDPSISICAKCVTEFSTKLDSKRGV